MKRKTVAFITAAATAAAFLPSAVTATAEYPLTQMEYLDRGTVAVQTSDGVYLSWRLLGTENYDTAFDIYRDGTYIATVRDSTNYKDTEVGGQYTVVPAGAAVSEGKAAAVNSEQYMTIPLDVPEGGISLDNEEYTYSPNDVTPADVDGDGEYELILKWEPSNSFDSGKNAKHNGNVYIDCYKLSGEKLWRIDMGININAGAHFTQMAAYDFDLDGKAELALKTAPGTVDGTGQYVSQASLIEEIRNTDDTADLRCAEYGSDTGGRVMSGDEYYTVFEGDTGAALDTIYYPHPRGTVYEWGDGWGNRSERYLSAVAYLDGVTPSMITWRGYYAKTTAAAYDLVDKRLVQVADFDTSVSGYEQFAGNGNHNITVGDADNDGRDEIFCGSLVLDDDFSVLWCSGRGHGDALHLADYDPEHEGLEYFSVHEDYSGGVITGSTTGNDGKQHLGGMTLYAAENGEELYHVDSGGDTGRGMMANVGYSDGYFDFWGAGTYTSYGGTDISKASIYTASTNQRIFWDGDVYDELLDGTGSKNTWIAIDGYGGRVSTLKNVLTNNDTKNNPCLIADLFGDWREEVVARSTDNKALIVYTTTIPTENKLYTLMHDRTYRMQVACQNAGYNQPPHIGYYINNENDENDMREYAAYIKTVHNGVTETRTEDLPPDPVESDEPEESEDPAPTPTPTPTPTAEPTPTPTPTPMFIIDENGTITEYNGSEDNLVIPETINGITVKAIGREVFYSDQTIDEITLPDTVTEIGTSAFSSSSLRTINAENIEKVGDYAFYNCSRLRELQFNKEAVMGWSAFYGCDSLEKLTIFGRNTYIENILALKNTKIFGYRASMIEYCALMAGMEFYDLETGERVIKEFVVDPSDGCLARYNGSETEVEIPAEVDGVAIEAVGEAFAGTDIESVKLAEGIKGIYYDAFSGCLSLKKVILPESMTRLLDSFSGCEALEYIEIPSSVSEIEEGIFESCPNVVIYCGAGSAAQIYAEENGIKYCMIGDTQTPAPAPTETAEPEETEPPEYTEAPSGPYELIATAGGNVPEGYIGIIVKCREQKDNTVLLFAEYDETGRLTGMQTKEINIGSGANTQFILPYAGGRAKIFVWDATQSIPYSRSRSIGAEQE